LFLDERSETFEESMAYT